MARTRLAITLVLVGAAVCGILALLSPASGPDEPIPDEVHPARSSRPDMPPVEAADEVGSLIGALSSGDENTRSRARRDLTLLRARAVPALLAILERGDDEIAARAEDILSEIGGPAVPGAKAMFASENARSRYRAVCLLCDLAHWWSRRPEGIAVVEDLLAYFSVSEPTTRMQIIHALGIAGPAATPHVDRLSGLLDNALPVEDLALAHAMMRLGTHANGTSAALIRLALRAKGAPPPAEGDDRNILIEPAPKYPAEAAWSAAYAVGGDPEGAAMLARLLARPPSKLDDTFLYLARAWGDAAHPALPGILDRVGRDETCSWALRAIGAMPGSLEDALPILLALPVRIGEWGGIGPGIPWRELREALVPLVPELLVALEDPDPDRRTIAAQALGATTDKLEEIGPALFRHLADPEVKVRLGVLDAFDRDSPPMPASTVELLAPALSDPDARVRTQAILALESTQASRKRTAELLAPLVAHPDDDTRFWAQTNMGWHGDPDPSVLPAVMVNLEHSLREVRLGALRVADALGPDAAPAVPILLDYRVDEEFGTWVTAIIARTGVLSPAVRNRLVRSLEDPEVTPPWDALAVYGPRVLDLESLVLSRLDRDKARGLDSGPAKALRAMWSGEGVLGDRLWSASRGSDPDAFRRVLRVAGLNPPVDRIVVDLARPLSRELCHALARDGWAAMPHLIEAAGLPRDPERAEFAVDLLAREARADSIEVLTDALARPSSGVRSAACRALGRVLTAGHHSERVVASLLRRLTDESDVVVAAACQALGHVPGPRRDLLVRLSAGLDSNSLLVSTKAAGAVWRHGGDTRTVLETLQRTLRAPGPRWGWYWGPGNRRARTRDDFDPAERPLEAAADLITEMGDEAAALAADVGWAAARAGDPVLQCLLVDALTAMGEHAQPARPDLVTMRETMSGWLGLSTNEEQLRERIEKLLAVIDE